MHFKKYYFISFPHELISIYFPHELISISFSHELNIFISFSHELLYMLSAMALVKIFLRILNFVRIISKNSIVFNKIWLNSQSLLIRYLLLGTFLAKITSCNCFFLDYVSLLNHKISKIWLKCFNQRRKKSTKSTNDDSVSKN